MPRLSCPVCRIALEEGGTHCPRCGLRVAALPRRPRPDRPARGGPRLSARPLVAAAQGLAAGFLLVAGIAVLATAAGLAGGPGRAVFGNVALVVTGLLLCLAVLLGDVHARRWTDFGELRERARTAANVGTRRIAILVAAAVCAAAFAGDAALR